MKGLTMLIWLTQLGISVAAPIGCGVLLAVWLQQRFSLGGWIIAAGVLLGLVGAFDGLRTSLKAMERMSRQNEEKEMPPTAFNDHM